MAPGFEYVVVQKKKDPICFGSKLPRSTGMIGKGLSSFQNRTAPPINPYVGPGTYNTEKYGTLKKPYIPPPPPAIKDAEGIVKQVVRPISTRFKDTIIRTPSPTRYETKIVWKPAPESRAPFGRKIKKKQESWTIDRIPGPGTYNIDYKRCPRTKFQSNLGNPTMEDAVEYICIPWQIYKCHKCGEMCEGDFWHVDYALFMCHLCWMEEKNTAEIYNEAQLKLFKKIRYCTFMHNHEGTTAHIWVLPPDKIKKKLRLESYLDLFLKC